ncbi:MAG TPA: response regulator transcription factor [Planctomicrobium sp.]|nr:response regulator transcription factor [Planctomicrobium sp.]
MTEDVLRSVIRVVCVDDHPLVRKGIASILNNEPDIALVAEAENGLEAIQRYRDLQPDVLLLDLRMPVLDGISAVKQIREEFPDARIIALTSFDGDQEIYRALEAGIRGYLLKESVHSEILDAIRKVHAGGTLVSEEAMQRLTEYFPKSALTRREVEVLQLISQGLANKEIAAQLGTADGTIKMHVQNLLQKLDATDRTHAVTIGLRRGIIHL